ncbi:uncharacterized protein LOC124949745 isoform X8 [Vespa velutina]|nr:uncharacterized protein LOC124949745 isoform X8 [Vespa velutina]
MARNASGVGAGARQEFAEVLDPVVTGVDHRCGFRLVSNGSALLKSNETRANGSLPIRRRIRRRVAKIPTTIANNTNHHHHHQSHQLNHHHHHHHIEVGSEILVPSGDRLTDDNVRQKLDSGAILVHGKEELPLTYDKDDNNKKRRPYSTGQLGHEKLNGLDTEDERRRLSDDELLRVRRVQGRRRLRSAGSDHEDYSTRNRNNEFDSSNDEDNRRGSRQRCQRHEDYQEEEDETGKDKNANARGNVNPHNKQSATLPRRRRRRALSGSFAGNPLPPHRVTPDGTAIYYWCELPRRPGSQELDDGAYNPLWTMRGFTQTFHFWKETRRAQSVPLNAFLTYITLPWWSIAKGTCYNYFYIGGNYIGTI